MYRTAVNTNSTINIYKTNHKINQTNKSRQQNYKNKNKMKKISKIRYKMYWTTVNANSTQKKHITKLNKQTSRNNSK